MYPLIPVLVLSACWWARQLQNVRALSVCRQAVTPIMLILFSNGLVSLGAMAADIAKDLRTDNVRVLESRPYSMKASLGSVEPLIQNCQGILSGEHAFFAAFTKLPFNKFYDIWEIPPIKTSDYDGLRPERIDCVLLYPGFSTDVGMGTNQLVRYENYIKPYVRRLLDSGARVYDLEKYGQVIILDKGTH